MFIDGESDRAGLGTRDFGSTDCPVIRSANQVDPEHQQSAGWGLMFQSL
jgi:hypothetical protein